jgi:hypothetical protein
LSFSSAKIFRAYLQLRLQPASELVAIYEIHSRSIKDRENQSLLLASCARGIETLTEGKVWRFVFIAFGPDLRIKRGKPMSEEK